MCSDLYTSKVRAVVTPRTTPCARSPRKEGQLVCPSADEYTQMNSGRNKGMIRGIWTYPRHDPVGVSSPRALRCGDHRRLAVRKCVRLSQKRPENCLLSQNPCRL